MTTTAVKKILLVDDEEALRLSLGEQLRLYEFITVETGTGVDALNLAKREYFDAILLDVGLPDMNGCDVCSLMRSSTPHGLLPSASILGQLAQIICSRSGSRVSAPYRAISVAFRYCPIRSHFEQASRTMAAGYSARLSDPSGMARQKWLWLVTLDPMCAHCAHNKSFLFCRYSLLLP